MIDGRAAGVFFAALWNKTILPGWTLEVTRFVISLASKFFQSKLSPLETKESHWDAMDAGFLDLELLTKLWSKQFPLAYPVMSTIGGDHRGHDSNSPFHTAQKPACI